MTENKISSELQHLVYWAVDILGKAILEEYGKDIYTQVETLRKKMKLNRGRDSESVHQSLRKSSSLLSRLSKKKLYQIAHSYGVMLELINRCESAYRVTRLEQKEQSEINSRPHAIIFVFTAHPTEARGEAALELFLAIQHCLEMKIKEKSDRSLEINHLLKLILKVPMGKNVKPTVEDEAKHIFGTVLKKEIIQEQINLKKRDLVVHFRSWVGGDKDGHPGVNEKTMVRSLQISRKAILDFIKDKIKVSKKHLKLISAEPTIFTDFDQKLKKVERIKDKDGLRVVSLTKEIKNLAKIYKKKVGVDSPELSEILDLVWLYPALVLPLEIREDSELVHAALENTQAPIAKMLTTLRTISSGHDPKWYIRGFVLSMVESSEDLSAGFKLCTKMLTKYAIPVVPLFENAKALTQATSILNEYFKKHPKVIEHHQKMWSSRFETMVGYSDSSKESGVFPSRWMIRRALVAIDQNLKKHSLVPVFFHGSGGSVERGGGSIKEQTQWWPKSAVDIFKATTQGEMVSRNFSSPTIMRSQVEKIAMQAAGSTIKNETVKEVALLDKFSNLVAKRYQQTVASDDFFEVIEKATPYNYLNVLKIGSRPSKRQTGQNKRKLRAIPWVLCWTQTRVLFPTWWGIGHAWKRLDKSEKAAMRKLYQNNELLSSFCKSLGFTLAKVELGVWRTYLDYSGLDQKTKKAVYLAFEHEYQAAREFLRSLTSEMDLLWHRPWLGESIFFRSAMIHPLNLIQLEALRRHDEMLVRETVTGISCGMLTTG
ncbi:MAG: phosphoenolpyruvate carboxylase [Bdellovibrionales bacterium CG12_big_fil_rev_8_21_14_0_65_38_15]|nr:MAG: phosphoenolpyruvate carboxylase [Bdellovibrionales bacterium CG22_combo_CG10-13_8_21_14_all_38_13]PIQ53344.1 MAG: phosphoenolpyruvate carboxylase [Bdellovibrionales bacterium CG12_big_fil_rev_8_21_14_0_65_38_15]PIR30292.1 MAG: phosphoenolpyruvate carboxylase [Bdellovibrionales bacterium CG11_big_fil_rev_8_21_14_0_20_38_13]